jgi:hypothetical protein
VFELRSAASQLSREGAPPIGTIHIDLLQQLHLNFWPAKEIRVTSLHEPCGRLPVPVVRGIPNQLDGTLDIDPVGLMHPTIKVRILFTPIKQKHIGGTD